MAKKYKYTPVVDETAFQYGIASSMPTTTNLDKYKNPTFGDDGNIPISPIANREALDETVAANQGAWELIGNAAGQAVTTFLGGTVSGTGSALDFIGLDSIGKPLEESGMDIEEFGRVNLPIYQTNLAQQGGFKGGFKDSTWWASHFPSVASAAASIVPSVGAVKLLSGLGKAAKAIGGLKGLSKLEKGNALLGLIAKNTPKALDKFGDVLQDPKSKYLFSVALGTHIDASMEINNSEREMMEYAKSIGMTDDEAKSYTEAFVEEAYPQAIAQSVLFNVVSFAELFKGADIISPNSVNKTLKMYGRDLSKNIKNGVDNEAIYKNLYINRARINSAKDIGKAVSNITFSEGLEEMSIDFALYDAEQRVRDAFDLYNTNAGSINNLTDHLSDAKSWDSFLWGAKGGLLMSGFRKSLAYQFNPKNYTNQLQSDFETKLRTINDAANFMNTSGNDFMDINIVEEIDENGKSTKRLENPVADFIRNVVQDSDMESLHLGAGFYENMENMTEEEMLASYGRESFDEGEYKALKEKAGFIKDTYNTFINNYNNLASTQRLGKKFNEYHNKAKSIFISEQDLFKRLRDNYIQKHPNASKVLAITSDSQLNNILKVEDELNAKIETLNVEIKDLEKRLNVKDELDGYNKSLKSINTSISNAKHQISKLDSQLKQERKELGRLLNTKKRIVRRDGKIETEDNSVYNKKDSITKLINQRTHLEAEILKFESLKSIEQAKIDKVNNSVERINGEISNKNSMVEQYNKDLNINKGDFVKRYMSLNKNSNLNIPAEDLKKALENEALSAHDKYNVISQLEYATSGQSSEEIQIAYGLNLLLEDYKKTIDEFELPENINKREANLEKALSDAKEVQDTLKKQIAKVEKSKEEVKQVEAEVEVNEQEVNKIPSEVVGDLIKNYKGETIGVRIDAKGDFNISNLQESILIGDEVEKGVTLESISETENGIILRLSNGTQILLSELNTDYVFKSHRELQKTLDTLQSIILSQEGIPTTDDVLKSITVILDTYSKKESFSLFERIVLSDIIKLTGINRDGLFGKIALLDDTVVDSFKETFNRFYESVRNGLLFNPLIEQLQLNSEEELNIQELKRVLFLGETIINRYFITYDFKPKSNSVTIDTDNLYRTQQDFIDIRDGLLDILGIDNSDTENILLSIIDNYFGNIFIESSNRTFNKVATILEEAVSNLTKSQDTIEGKQDLIDALNDYIKGLKNGIIAKESLETIQQNISSFIKAFNNTSEETEYSKELISAKNILSDSTLIATINNSFNPFNITETQSKTDVKESNENIDESVELFSNAIDSLIDIDSDEVTTQTVHNVEANSLEAILPQYVKVLVEPLTTLVNAYYNTPYAKSREHKSVLDYQVNINDLLNVIYRSELSPENIETQFAILWDMFEYLSANKDSIISQMLNENTDIKDKLDILYSQIDFNNTAIRNNNKHYKSIIDRHNIKKSSAQNNANFVKEYTKKYLSLNRIENFTVTKNRGVRSTNVVKTLLSKIEDLDSIESSDTIVYEVDGKEYNVVELLSTQSDLEIESELEIETIPQEGKSPILVGYSTNSNGTKIPIVEIDLNKMNYRNGIGLTELKQGAIEYRSVFGTKDVTGKTVMDFINTIYKSIVSNPKSDNKFKLLIDIFRAINEDKILGNELQFSKIQKSFEKLLETNNPNLMYSTEGSALLNIIEEAYRLNGDANFGNVIGDVESKDSIINYILDNNPSEFVDILFGVIEPMFYNINEDSLYQTRFTKEGITMSYSNLNAYLANQVDSMKLLYNNYNDKTKLVKDPIVVSYITKAPLLFAHKDRNRVDRSVDMSKSKLIFKNTDSENRQVKTNLTDSTVDITDKELSNISQIWIRIPAYKSTTTDSKQYSYVPAKKGVLRTTSKSDGYNEMASEFVTDYIAEILYDAELYERNADKDRQTNEKHVRITNMLNDLSEAIIIEYSDNKEYWSRFNISNLFPSGVKNGIPQYNKVIEFTSNVGGKMVGYKITAYYTEETKSKLKLQNIDLKTVDTQYDGKTETNKIRTKLDSKGNRNFKTIALSKEQNHINLTNKSIEDIASVLRDNKFILTALNGLNRNVTVGFNNGGSVEYATKARGLSISEIPFYSKSELEFVGDKKFGKYKFKNPEATKYKSVIKTYIQNKYPSRRINTEYSSMEEFYLQTGAVTTNLAPIKSGNKIATNYVQEGYGRTVYVKTKLEQEEQKQTRREQFISEIKSKLGEPTTYQRMSISYADALAKLENTDNYKDTLAELGLVFIENKDNSYYEPLVNFLKELFKNEKNGIRQIPLYTESEGFINRIENEFKITDELISDLKIEQERYNKTRATFNIKNNVISVSQLLSPVDATSEILHELLHFKVKQDLKAKTDTEFLKLNISTKIFNLLNEVFNREDENVKTLKKALGDALGFDLDNINNLRLKHKKILINEIITYSLTNKDIANLMNSIVVESTNEKTNTLWSQIIDFILDFLGVKLNTDSALNELVNILSNIDNVGGIEIVEKLTDLSTSSSPPAIIKEIVNSNSNSEQDIRDVDEGDLIFDSIQLEFDSSLQEFVRKPVEERLRRSRVSSLQNYTDNVLNPQNNVLYLNNQEDLIKDFKSKFTDNDNLKLC